MNLTDLLLRYFYLHFITLTTAGASIKVEVL